MAINNDNNYIDEVNATLTITNKKTNEDVVLYGKVMDMNPDNPMTVSLSKDNLSLAEAGFAYFENSTQASTLTFNCVNIDPLNNLKILKKWFYEKAQLSIIYVSGANTKSLVKMTSCYLQKEPMSPKRSTDWKSDLSFIGGTIEEIFE